MDNNFSNILDIFKRLDETTMADAKRHPEGPKFTGYWKGTDAGTPGTKMVGASEGVEECDEPMTLTDRLKARWEETKRKSGLQEYGMTTGGTLGGASASTDSTQDQAKQTATLQQNVNKLKGAGLNIPNVGQAVQSMTKDPATDPATAQDKQIAAGLGQDLEQLAKGDPNTVSQLASLIQKNKQQQKQGGVQ